MEDSWDDLLDFDALDGLEPDAPDDGGTPADPDAPQVAANASAVEQYIQQNAKAAFGKASQHGNLTFLPLQWLHQGPRSLTGAQVVLIRRHRDDSYKGMYLYIEFWGRQRNAEPFQRKKRVHLDLEVTENLLTYLHQAEASAEVQAGPYVVLPAAQILDNLDAGQQQVFVHLLSDMARSRRVTELFATGLLTTETLDNLAAAALHAKYKAELMDLDDMVSGHRGKEKRNGEQGSLTEHDFQKWFEQHTWLFGTEYIRRISFREIDPGSTIDLLLETADGFFDVLELKTPAAPVLKHDPSHLTWYWSPDVAKVIAQAAKYLHAIERSADRIFHDKHVSLLRPRVRVVIGRSDAWSEPEQEAFRRLSATLHGIELMTFDHVLERARRLVDCYEQDHDLATP